VIYFTEHERRRLWSSGKAFIFLPTHIRQLQSSKKECSLNFNELLKLPGNNTVRKSSSFFTVTQYSYWNSRQKTTQ